MSEWIVDFKGRNKTGSINQNFIWRQKNIYIMDNHQAALWCWLQHINLNQKYGLFHIDQHCDVGPNNIVNSGINPTDLWKMNFDEYIGLKYPSQLDGGKLHSVFNHGNYISVLYEHFPDILAESIFVTQKEGRNPNFQISEKEIFHLLANFDFWLGNKLKWILNIDLDFFFNHKEDENYLKFLHTDFIKDLAKEIKNVYDNGKLEVITIALSPDFCNGWRNSEEILKIFTDELGLNFVLPVSVV